MFIKIKEHKIFYQEINSREKETIVFIHGLGTDHNCFREQVLFFKKKNFRLILIDLPGFGQSKVDGKLGFFDEVDIASEFIKKLELSKFHIIGLSLGGMITLELAKKKIANLDKIILLSTPISFRKLRLKKQVTLYLRLFISFKLLARLVSRKSFPYKDQREQRKEFYNQLLNSDRETYRQIVKDLKRYDFAGEIKNIPNKILAIYGASDKVIKSKIQASYLKDREVKILKGGHVITEEKELVKMNQEILAFLYN